MHDLPKERGGPGENYQVRPLRECYLILLSYVHLDSYIRDGLLLTGATKHDQSDFVLK